MEAGRGGQREKGVSTPFWAVAVLILGAQENWRGLLGRIFEVSPGPFLGPRGAFLLASQAYRVSAGSLGTPGVLSGASKGLSVACCGSLGRGVGGATLKKKGILKIPFFSNCKLGRWDTNPWMQVMVCWDGSRGLFGDLLGGFRGFLRGSSCLLGGSGSPRPQVVRCDFGYQLKLEGSSLKVWPPVSPKMHVPKTPP